MGGALRVLGRPFRNINIESRAHRQLDKIEKGKPQPAPKHKLSRAAQRLYDESVTQLAQDESLMKKDESLAEKLKTLEVKSIDPHLEKKVDPSRPLPERHPPKQESKYGDPVVKHHTKGKVTLQEVLSFLAEHHGTPRHHAVEQIAKKHLLDKRKVEQVLSHYGLFKQLDFRDPKAQKKLHWELKESQESVIGSIPTSKRRQDKTSAQDFSLPSNSDLNKKGS